MGTEKLRNMNRGLGMPRCKSCISLRKSDNRKKLGLRAAPEELVVSREKRFCGENLKPKHRREKSD